MANVFRFVRHAWNAFLEDERNAGTPPTILGPSSYNRPDRMQLRWSNEKSIIAAVLTRMAVDASSFNLRHIRVDDEGRYAEDVDSGLNNCLTVEANVDQAATAFLRDSVMTLFDEGTIAIVPTDTTFNPRVTGSYDITAMRVGKIVEWRPRDVKVSVYDDRPEKGGERREIWVPKTVAAIVENPFYTIMNERSSTLQRLIRKLNLLDVVDEQSSSGKLDLIIQLPYTIRSEAKRDQAEKRRTDIEFQLKNSKYGIAYTDGTEKVTQLNRPAENNLLAQVEYLTKMLYSQLGLTEEIMNGTADEQAMINYLVRTIQPVLDAIVEAMRRVFLTKTARSQGQSIMYFRDPFKLITAQSLAELADKLSRNEIVAPNDFRPALGLKPSKDPSANKLVNRNMPQPQSQSPPVADSTPKPVNVLPIKKGA